MFSVRSEISKEGEIPKKYIYIHGDFDKRRHRRGKEECIFAAAALNSPLAATRYTRAILLYNETFMCIRVLWEEKCIFW